jgi:putative oxidoreductase
MTAGKSEDIGKLLLRISVGFVLILHGYFKILHGVDWLKAPLAEIGLPGFIAYGVYIGEFIAPLMLILGYRIRIAAPLMMINMIVAIYMFHRNQILSIKEAGGGWAIELDALILLGALAMFFLGGGKFCIKGGNGYWD